MRNFICSLRCDSFNTASLSSISPIMWYIRTGIPFSGTAIFVSAFVAPSEAIEFSSWVLPHPTKTTTASSKQRISFQLRMTVSSRFYRLTTCQSPILLQRIGSQREYLPSYHPERGECTVPHHRISLSPPLPNVPEHQV